MFNVPGTEDFVPGQGAPLQHTPKAVCVDISNFIWRPQSEDTSRSFSWKMTGSLLWRRGMGFSPNPAVQISPTCQEGEIENMELNWSYVPLWLTWLYLCPHPHSRENYPSDKNRGLCRVTAPQFCSLCPCHAIQECLITAWSLVKWLNLGLQSEVVWVWHLWL